MKGTTLCEGFWAHDLKVLSIRQRPPRSVWCRVRWVFPTSLHERMHLYTDQGGTPFQHSGSLVVELWVDYRALSSVWIPDSKYFFKFFISIWVNCGIFTHVYNVIWSCLPPLPSLVPSHPYWFPSSSQLVPLLQSFVSLPRSLPSSPSSLPFFLASLFSLVIFL